MERSTHTTTGERIAMVEGEIQLIERMERDGHFVTNGAALRRELQQLLHDLIISAQTCAVPAADSSDVGAPPPLRRGRIDMLSL